MLPDTGLVWPNLGQRTTEGPGIGELMRRDSRTPIWPHVAVVVLLFVLCVLAPRSWQSVSVEGSRALRHDAVNTRHSGMMATGPTIGADSESDGADNPLSLDPADQARDLANFAAPRAEAQVAPPVGERIDLDPSISDRGPSTPVHNVLTAVVPIDLTRKNAESPPADREAADTFQRTDVETRALDTALPQPVVLLESIRTLTSNATTRDWADRVLRQLERVARTDPEVEGELERQLAGLRVLAEQSLEIAARMEPDATRAALLRASYALQRRVDLWERCRAIISQTVLVNVASVGPPVDVARWVAAAEKQLSGVEHGLEWRQYLLLDDARRLADPRASATAEERRELARRILRRIESPLLSRKQKEFFEQAPFTHLAADLKHWVSEPIDYAQLLDHIERYELQASAADARAVAKMYEVLRWSPTSKIQELGDHVNSHYRNANIRLAISGDLINRMLPTPQPIDQDVNDMILGARVFGRSRAMTRLRVVLVPDRWRWRLGLEAQGEVASETESRKGPARFFSRGRADYRAHKLLLVDRRGTHLLEATADAESESDLTDIRTEFDGIPIVNKVIRAFARRGYDENRMLARWETDSRVRDGARSTMDDEVAKQLKRIETEFSNRLLAPLHRLDLKPLAVGMETTEERLIVRYRLASDRQLAAYTPRPQAPANSLFSAQIHESAINNVVDQLRLDGRTVNLRELMTQLAADFGRADLQIPEDIPDDVRIRFADAEAVRVRFADDRLQITVRVAELSQGRNRFEHFWITTSYSRAEPAGLQTSLVRDGIVSVGGVGFSDRFPLRAIFGRVFSKTHPLVIVNEKIAADPRLAGCHLTLVARDGWIGASLAPAAKSDDERLARQKQK